MTGNLAGGTTADSTQNRMFCARLVVRSAARGRPDLPNCLCCLACPA